MSKRTLKFIVEAPTERQKGKAPVENSGENSGESPGESSGESIVGASVKSRKRRKSLDVQNFEAGSSLPTAAPTSSLRTEQYSKKRKKVEAPVESRVVEAPVEARKNFSPAARFWEDAIDKFETGEIFDSQEYIVPVSLMSQEDQQIFVEAATYFYDEPLEQALAAWDSACGNSHEKWKKLLSMSMVREVHKSASHSLGEIREDQDVTLVWVHELLRDRAKSLLKDHVASASKFVNWLRADTDILQLPSGNRKYDTDFDGSHTMLPTDLLDKCEVLKYVDLDGVILEGLHENFGTNLRLLRWEMRSMTQLPLITLEKLDNLSVLELSNWRVPTEFSEALENLSNLRILSLGHLEGLNRLPDSFGQLRGLKWLELVRLSLLALPKSFGNLHSLQHLSLVNLRIATLPDSFGLLSALQHLSFVNVKLQSLPKSFGELSSLRTMAIRNCEEIQSLPERFGLLSALQHLSLGLPSSSRELVLHRCTQLTKLPDIFGPLMILTIEEDDQLEALSSCLRELTTLRRLTLVNVSSVELPESLLDGLVMFTIRSCQTLSCLPSSFGRFSSLKELYIENCPLFSTLQGLELDDSFEKELGDSIQVPWGWFISLENLTLSGCRITSELLCAILDTIRRVFVTSLALTRFDLHDNLLEDQAFQILLTWADHLQHLKELDLGMNRGMNSSGLMSFIETIQSGHLPSLQRVNWVGNRYSEATAQAITQAYY